MWLYLQSLSFICLALQTHCLPWSWDNVALWADFGTNNISLLSDYQAKFVGSNYKLISLEKCLGQPSVTNISTEDSFYQISSKIREYNPSQNTTQILFYFNLQICLCDCYDITNSFCNNESMWLKNETGYPIFNGNNKNRPYFDMTQLIVQNYWVNIVTNVIKTALFTHNITVNGVFADGSCIAFGNQLNSQTTLEYQNGIYNVLDKTRQAFSQIKNDYKKYKNKNKNNNNKKFKNVAENSIEKMENSIIFDDNDDNDDATIDLMVLSNGLSSYSIQPDHCVNTIPHSDGVLIEHFGAFEEILANSNINASDIILWINIINDIIINKKYGNNKSVFIKSWIGPEVTPIDNYGPTWPKTYKYYPRPKNHSQIAHYSSMLITFPLATYLCAMAYENVYFNYAFWYDITQGYVPCTNNPDTCDCPSNWYDEFVNKLGKPITNPIIDNNNYQCNRQFEFANVSVNWLNDSSGAIQWA